MLCFCSVKRSGGFFGCFVGIPKLILVLPRAPALSQDPDNGAGSRGLGSSLYIAQSHIASSRVHIENRSARGQRKL